MAFKIPKLSASSLWAMLVELFASNDFHLTSTQAKTELFASSIVLMIICLVISVTSGGADLTLFAVCFDFIRSGVAGVVAQLCDAYMFYDRLRVAAKGASMPLPLGKRLFIHAYIWIVLILPWAPTYSIVPFMYDTNSPGYVRYFGYANVVYCFASIAYYCYFTLESLLVIRKISLRLKAVTRDDGRGIGGLRSLTDSPTNTAAAREGLTNHRLHVPVGHAEVGSRARVGAEEVRPPMDLSHGGGLGADRTQVTCRTAGRGPNNGYDDKDLVVTAQQAEVDLHDQDNDGDGAGAGGRSVPRQVPKLLSVMNSIAWRSIAHAAASSLGLLMFLLAPSPYNFFLYAVITPLGMHIWFNIPYWTKLSRSRSGAPSMLDRMVREQRNGHVTSFVNRVRHKDKVTPG
jgi:hypothetical protein